MKTKIYQTPSHPEGSFKNYLTGYFISIVLTLIAFFSVTKKAFSGKSIVYLISFLALIQFVIQIVFFLHLFNERKPRFRLLVFLLMLSIVLILIVGSLWIMNNLNNNMNISTQVKYMNNQGGGF